MKEIEGARSLKLAVMQFKGAGGIFYFVFFVSQKKKGILAEQHVGWYLLFSDECFHELNIVTEMLLYGPSLELLYCLLIDCFFRVTILFNCVIQRSVLFRHPNSSPTVLKSSVFFIIFKPKIQNVAPKAQFSCISAYYW